MPDCRSKLGSCVEPGLHTSLLRSFPPMSDAWGQDLRNYPPPRPHCPYQPRLAKCQVPSLGSLISHRPGPALNHPSSPHALSKCPPVTSTSPPGPSLTPHLLTRLPSLNFALYPQFPPLPNSSLLQTPQLPLLSPAFSQALSQPSLAPHLPPPTSPLSASSTWDSLSSLPSPPFRSPNSSPSPALFTPVPCPLDQPEHLLGKRRGLLLTWRPQSSGAAAPSGRGGKCNPTGLPSQLVPYREWTTIAACQLLLRLDLGGFLDSCFLGVRKVQRPHCDPEVTFEKFCWGRGIQRLTCPIGSVPRLCLKSGPFSPAPCSRPPSPLSWIDCGIHLPSLLAPSQILPGPEGYRVGHD